MDIRPEDEKLYQQYKTDEEYGHVYYIYIIIYIMNVLLFFYFF